MKVYSFFRLLNQKIKQYEKTVSNPFDTVKKPVTIIWVEGVMAEKKNSYEKEV